MAFGVAAVAAFSLTLPFTRFVVAEMTPVMVGLGRAVLAGLVAALILLVTRTRAPPRRVLGRLAMVSAGVVLGFPLLTAWAMQHVPAAHGGVVLGVLPLATAVAGALLGGERPSPGFWLAGVAGSVTVVVFAVADGGGSLQLADLALLGAVLSAAVGYAEGARISRSLGAWQVICWALVLALPFTAVPVLWDVVGREIRFSGLTWAGFLYLALVSQLGAFLLWYRGMAIGGIARVSQAQLLQPFFTIGASAVLLNERIQLTTIAFAVVVVITVAVGRRMPVRRA
jgi:drug/metabolite transporter (DMT)-like permease